MSDRPAGRVLDALESEPWLITQGAMDQLREVAAREHDFEAAAARYRGANDVPLSFRPGVAPSTAVLDVRGALTRRATFFSDVSGLSSTDALSDEFARLEADEDVERIVLRFDSPGGAVNGLAEFAQRIHDATTPTVAYVSDTAASAGYWLASQADTVVVSPTAITGSIGVRSRAPDRPDPDEMVSRHAPAKLGDRAASQAALDRIEREFHAAIARGRGVTAEHVAQHFGRGGIFIGADAVEAGLADAVSTFDHVIAGESGTTEPRRRRGQPPRRVRMGQQDENDGTVTSAEHTRAVEAAREDGRKAGHEAGKAEAEAVTGEKVAAERDRVVAIIEAGEGKPMSAVAKLAKNPAITSEDAKAFLEDVADVKAVSSLTGEMAGTNPSLAADQDGDPAIVATLDPTSRWGNTAGGKG